MNIIKKEGRYYFWCYKCNEELEVGDLLRVNDDIICVICGSHLGYFYDLPDEVKDIIHL